MKRLVTLCMSFVMLAMVLTQVHARDFVDTSAQGSIVLSYPVSEIPFSLYRVGDMDQSGTPSFSGAYAEYPLSLDCKEQSEWQALADTIAMYIAKDGLEADATVVTDGEGKASFENVAVGLYLVNWESHETENEKYTAQPLLVSVPNVDERDAWVYDLTPTLKYGVEPVDHDTVDLKVHKVWDDNKDSYKKRPASISVDLLRDGEVVETVVLSQENGWSASWEKLDDRYDWKVSEVEVPKEYTMTVTKEGNTFVVTNKIKPDVPEKPNKPETPPDLPQTGMLWWPVPVLAAVGVGCVLVGNLMKNRKA